MCLLRETFRMIYSINNERKQISHKLKMKVGKQMKLKTIPSSKWRQISKQKLQKFSPGEKRAKISLSIKSFLLTFHIKHESEHKPNVIFAELVGKHWAVTKRFDYNDERFQRIGQKWNRFRENVAKQLCSL